MSQVKLGYKKFVDCSNRLTKSNSTKLNYNVKLKKLQLIEMTQNPNVQELFQGLRPIENKIQLYDYF